MKGIVIGAGEVGRGIFDAVLPTYGDTAIVDVGDVAEGPFEIGHICYPQHDAFVQTTVDYAEKYGLRYVVNHSTVRPGTTRAIQRRLPDKMVVHAPVEGRHQDFVTSMMLWRKPLGCVAERVGDLHVSAVADYFARAGIGFDSFGAPENSEVAKMLSTTRLGFESIWHRVAQRICEHHDADYSVAVTRYTQSYNDLYDALGLDQFHRSNLQPYDEIGGHCVKPNMHLSDSPWMRHVRDFILGLEPNGE